MPIGKMSWRVAVGGDASFYRDKHIERGDVNMSQDAVEELVGDGAAHVTCSVGLKDSNYGTGFEAFCSVQLSCNQDRSSIEIAQVLALELVEGGLEDAVEAAQDLFRKHVSSRDRK